jgi:hypothetical protein
VTIEQQGAETNEPLTADGTARVRATSATARATLPAEPPDPALVTAELPAVPRGAGRSPELSRYADPDRRRGGINKREPAPVALRIVVWSLFFVFLVALAGVLVADLRPDWLSSVRNDVHSPTTPSPTSTTLAPARSTTKISVVSTSSSLVSYSVPASTYTIVIETAEPCWTTIHSPIGAATFLFARTIPANSSKTVTVSTTAQVITSNTVRAIRIMSGSKKLGTISAPKPLVKYTFTPSGS